MAVENSMKFTGLDLKIARIKAGLKQYEVAARVGIGPTQLCEIETGRREPSPQLVGRIRKVLGSNDKKETPAGQVHPRHILTGGAEERGTNEQ